MTDKRVQRLIVAPALATMALLFAFLLLGQVSADMTPSGNGSYEPPLVPDINNFEFGSPEATRFNKIVITNVRSVSDNIKFVWPISGSASTPDLPQSSAYGPRLQASRDFDYDYHQGIDLPTPISTPLLAVTTSTVTIAGSHSGYENPVVQLYNGNGLYINYLHITRSLVTTGDEVAKGQPIALSGVSTPSGFPHLHFEIRRGSSYRKDAINPYRYLPYPDTASHTVAITEVLTDNAVWVQVTAPAYELDVNQITLTVRSSLTPTKVFCSRILDYEARNKKYNGDPDQLDNPNLEYVLIEPHRFSSTSSLYVVDFKFHHLSGLDQVRIHACAIDVKGNRQCAEASGEFIGFSLYLPLIIRE